MNSDNTSGPARPDHIKNPRSVCTDQADQAAGDQATASGQGLSRACLETALKLLRLGYSPVPPLEDGSKAPLADIPDPDPPIPGVKTKWTWKGYQTHPATEAHIRAWYKNGRTGVGAAGGVGGLDPFEFDSYDVYEHFLVAAVAVGLGDLVERVMEGYEENSPGGGIHWLARSPNTAPSTKLARRFKREDEFNDADVKTIEAAKANGKEHRPIKTLIETKGQGGFIILAPSNGKVHPSGGQYRLRKGSLDTIADITADEREQLWNLARTFDEMPEPVKSTTWDDVRVKDGSRGAFPDAGKRPGDDFEARATIAEIMEPSGWVKVHASGQVEYWRRPGKDQGWSATWGHCKGFKD
jgi:putative DNA primase/helicase